MLGDSLVTIGLLPVYVTSMCLETYADLQSEQLVELFKHTQFYLRYRYVR